MHRFAPLRLSFAAIAVAIAAGGACHRTSSGEPDGGDEAGADAQPAQIASAEESASAPPPAPPPPPKIHCPKGMMDVGEKFCVDKWEAQIIDKATHTPLSPYYPPDRKLAIELAATWETERETMGDEKAKAVPIPDLPQFQRDNDFEPMAISRAGVLPNGYLSGVMAARACENAGKRICRYDEWRTACEGEEKRQFPYGITYVQGACNIFREAHPGAVLHDNAAIGHLDPRLNLVLGKEGDPLLRLTGQTPRCKSEWGGDAAYDMNGNLDEWVLDTDREPDPKTGWKGRMVGGFFSRSKKDGCASSITAHPKGYLDYSTGTRCCWSPDDIDAGAPTVVLTDAGAFTDAGAPIDPRVLTDRGVVTDAGAAGAMDAGSP